MGRLSVSGTALIAPAAYRQGPGVLDSPGAFGDLRGPAVVLGGETALDAVGDRLRRTLEAAGTPPAAVESGVDACTFERIDRLAGIARGVDARTVVGVGGGTALDAAKGVADAVDAALVTVPTVASTDAPCSAVAVVYDDAGAFAGYVHRDRNPERVLVDTGVLAAAPTRFLRAGLGDAFATRFEAAAAAHAGATTHAGGHATVAARALARRCYGVLEADGAEALSAVDRGAVTPAVERAVEAVVLLSGIGFESGGLAAAHAFSKGFAAAGATAPHGLTVAFGTVAMLLLAEEHGSWEPAIGRHDALELYHALGLDRRLSELGIADADVDRVAVAACDEGTTMGNQPGEIGPDEAAGALRAADELIGRTRARG